MSTVFTATGASGVLDYADDSTEVSIEVPVATHLLVFNPDTANVVVVSVGQTDGDVDAIVPTSDFNGSGVVVAPSSTMIIAVPQSQFVGGTMWISVAGVSGTGNVYITPGTV